MMIGWREIFIAIAAIVVAEGLRLLWRVCSEAETKSLSKEKVYEDFACAQCGNFTVVRETGWAICDCCGMKVEMD